MAQFEDKQFYQYPPFNPIIPAPVWGKDAEYAVPVVSSVGSGPKGEKGDPVKFEDLTDEQKDLVYNEVAKNVVNYGYQLEQGYFTTDNDNTSIIEIPIEDWSAYDILLVDIEGLLALSGTDYNIVGNTIHLTTPITHSGTRVGFSAIKVSIPEGEKAVVNTTHIVPEIEATVDNVHLSNPTVEVVMTEDGGLKLNFSGLAGEKGDTGETGATGTDGFNATIVSTYQDSSSTTVAAGALTYLDLTVVPGGSSVKSWLDDLDLFDSSDGSFTGDWIDVASPELPNQLMYAKWQWVYTSGTGSLAIRLWVYNPSESVITVNYPVSARLIVYKKPE